MDSTTDREATMVRSVRVEDADDRLGELLDQLSAGQVVHLTRKGERVGVLLDRQTYDQLLVESSRDAREELAAMADATRTRVAIDELSASIVDEAIAAVRSR